ncbi:hypothetical protein [Ferrimonas marina]|uniref:Uncharacterized protein n=1 Tax=Ferrimonas marina TaxID=299255 RepID=A0A1M5Z4X1_9GAMM|nr:hypothetical protein [Ferrimonas marina]SHI19259.1 hypothetical protein SAMN02745129_4649 [Ferrimonas marina]
MKRKTRKPMPVNLVEILRISVVAIVMGFGLFVLLRRTLDSPILAML